MKQQYNFSKFPLYGLCRNILLFLFIVLQN